MKIITLLILIVIVTISYSGCSKSNNENIVTSTETTHIETSETTTTTTTTESTTTETTTINIVDSLIEKDKLLSVYLDYTNYIYNSSFDTIKEQLTIYAKNNDYSLEVTEPTSEIIGDIKLLNNSDNYVYFAFYPNQDNIETLSAVEYSLNSEISISASNEMNFYISKITYKTRNTNREEVNQTVSNIDEQINFLANIKWYK